jgi:hypothetical protein
MAKIQSRKASSRLQLLGAQYLKICVVHAIMNFENQLLKICASCKMLKPKNEFYVGTKKRLRSRCKSCEYMAHKQYNKRLQGRSIDQIETPSHKQCNICKTTKPIPEFARVLRSVDGHDWTCKTCKNLSLKKYVIQKQAKSTAPTEIECNKCKHVLPAKQFHKDTTHYTGYRTTCKTCRNRRKRELWALQLENARLRAKMSYKRNKAQAQRYKKENVNYRISQLTRDRIRNFVTRANKCQHTAETLGCSYNFCRKWIEFQFSRTMTWQNYGTDWEIDHVRPCASFDLKDNDDVLSCFNWTNIRPLEKYENRSKNNKRDSVVEEYHLMLAHNYVLNINYDEKLEKELLVKMVKQFYAAHVLCNTL